MPSSVVVWSSGWSSNSWNDLWNSFKFWSRAEFLLRLKLVFEKQNIKRRLTSNQVGDLNRLFRERCNTKHKTGGWFQKRTKATKCWVLSFSFYTWSGMINFTPVGKMSLFWQFCGIWWYRSLIWMFFVSNHAVATALLWCGGHLQERDIVIACLSCFELGVGVLWWYDDAIRRSMNKWWLLFFSVLSFIIHSFEHQRRSKFIFWVIIIIAKVSN